MSTQALLSLTANGVMITAYVISDETLGIMKAMFCDKTIDPEYDSPLHMADENAIKAISITKGLSEDGFESGSLTVGKTSYQIDGVVVTSGDESFEEACEHNGFGDPNDCLESNSERILPLGLNFKVPDNCHLVVEVLEFDEGEFSCEFEVRNPRTFNPSDIKLIGYDLDVETDLSAASYGVGLTGCMEHDLLGFEFEDEYFEFEAEIPYSSSNIHLISKGEAGLWIIDHDAESWING